MKEMVTQLRPIVGTKAVCRHLELSRAMADVLDPGLALFAGLGAMPKQSTPHRSLLPRASGQHPPPHGRLAQGRALTRRRTGKGRVL